MLTDLIELTACPACGCEERTFWLRDRNRREGIDIQCDSWKYSNCRSIYLSPVPNASTVQDLYSDSHEQPPIRGFIEHQGDRVVDTWARIWSPDVRLRGEPREAGRGRSLLSIGCGYATALGKYSDLGWEVSGVDPDPQAIEWNRQHSVGAFYEGAFEDVDFNETFDVIHCSAVIEHVYEPLKFLQKARGLLRPGGRLLFFTPNGGGAMTKFIGRYSIACWVPFHLVLFTRDGLSLLAERAGLSAKVVSIADPHLASLSLRQWRSRNRSSFRLKKGWDTRTTTTLISPIWALLNRFALGEELAMIAVRSDED